MMYFVDFVFLISIYKISRKVDVFFRVIKRQKFLTLISINFLKAQALCIEAYKFFDFHM